MVACGKAASQRWLEREAREAGGCELDSSASHGQMFDAHPQVCYGWWVLSAMSILGKLHWIDADGLMGFILASQVSENAMREAIRGGIEQMWQDVDGGGISDRPGDMVDVFHTLFGVAGESEHRREMARH